MPADGRWDLTLSFQHGEYGELLIMPADSRWDLTLILLTWRIW